MAASDINVGTLPSTIECDDEEHTATFNALASVLNSGSKTVFLCFLQSGAIPTDGGQHVGTVPIAPGSSFPLPSGYDKFRYVCLAGETSTLLFIPA